MNLFGLTLVTAGGILIYCAIKGYDPRDVVKQAIKGGELADLEQKYVVGDDGLAADIPDLIPGEPGDDGGVFPGIPDPADILPVNDPRRKRRPNTPMV